MANVYEVDSAELIEKSADELKKIDSIKPAAWAPFVKTGVHKERPPLREDWWYIRAASILRKIYVLGPIGVSKLRRKYGGKRNQGHNTEHSDKGSGSIIRKILQQLQKAELVKYVEKGVHKGRVIAPKGVALLDKVATEIYTRINKSKPKPAAPVEDAKPEEKAEKAEKQVKAEKAESSEPKVPKPKKERKEKKKQEKQETEVKEKPAEEAPKNE